MTARVGMDMIANWHPSGGYQTNLQEVRVQPRPQEDERLVGLQDPEGPKEGLLLTVQPMEDPRNYEQLLFQGPTPQLGEQRG